MILTFTFAEMTTVSYLEGYLSAQSGSRGSCVSLRQEALALPPEDKRFDTGLLGEIPYSYSTLDKIELEKVSETGICLGFWSIASALSGV